MLIDDLGLAGFYFIIVLQDFYEEVDFVVLLAQRALAIEVQWLVALAEVLTDLYSVDFD